MTFYEAYFGANPNDPLSLLNDEGKAKALDYINQLHASGIYEKKTAKIISFRKIDIFETPVSAEPEISLPMDQKKLYVLTNPYFQRALPATKEPLDG